MDKVIKKVISEKRGIEGELLLTPVVNTLTFSWADRTHTVGLGRGLSEEELIAEAARYMDDFAKLKEGSGENTAKNPKLYYWYLERIEGHNGEYLIAHGNVTGHERLADTMFIHTSKVRSYWINRESGQMILQTRNTEYICDLAYCDFEKQEEHKELLPNFERLREQYERTIPTPEIEPGNVLLVLSDHDDYYFHSLFCIPQAGEEKLSCDAYPHVGMFQDSFLITGYMGKDEINTRIDLRYFPHFGNIEMYSEETSGMPWYVENIGASVLFVQASAGTIKLGPGERKQISPENAEKEVPILPDGDLYPAQILDES